MLSCLNSFHQHFNYLRFHRYASFFHNSFCDLIIIKKSRLSNLNNYLKDSSIADVVQVEMIYHCHKYQVIQYYLCLLFHYYRTIQFLSIKVRLIFFLLSKLLAFLIGCRYLRVFCILFGPIDFIKQAGLAKVNL